jgi:hypothetical protein
MFLVLGLFLGSLEACCNKIPQQFFKDKLQQDELDQDTPIQALVCGRCL